MEVAGYGLSTTNHIRLQNTKSAFYLQRWLPRGTEMDVNMKAIFVLFCFSLGFEVWFSCFVQDRAGKKTRRKRLECFFCSDIFKKSTLVGPPGFHSRHFDLTEWGKAQVLAITLTMALFCSSVRASRGREPACTTPGAVLLFTPLILTVTCQNVFCEKGRVLTLEWEKLLHLYLL